MYVCLCKAVTDRQIRQAVGQGACTMRALRQTLGVCTGCGRCAQHVLSELNEALPKPCERRQA
ncbi:MAG: (2Fe-2S)-binding protein [Betaproteobacteria bacterium]|nr:(2Fe-2S)-binding protein [Betaproteobacteria bacterium]